MTDKVAELRTEAEDLKQKLAALKQQLNDANRKKKKLIS